MAAQEGIPVLKGRVAAKGGTLLQKKDHTSFFRKL